jgi:DNA-binding PadR family transcriptional regulator
MEEYKELLSNLTSELRRGTIVLSVLSQVSGSVYGYSLIQDLSQLGIEVEANTLYPLLRRLEKQGILKSKWETSSGKPRKYYARTSMGDQMYTELLNEWNQMVTSMNTLLREGEKNE